METQNLNEIKGRIANYWNGRATLYDGQFGHGIFSEEEKLIWLKTLGANIRQPQGARILDAGCGTGFLSLLLAELGYEVTGLDFSDEMLAEAHRKAEKHGLKINLMRGDAENPPLPGQTFQAVISRHVLWTLPNPEQAMTSWSKLLTAGGQVVVIDGVWTPRTPYARFMHLISKGVMKIKGRETGKGWEKEYMKTPGELPFMGGAEPERVVRLFQKTGLENIRVDDMTDVIRHERKTGPLEHTLRYAAGKSRYLVSGVSPNGKASG